MLVRVFSVNCFSHEHKTVLDIPLAVQVFEAFGFLSIEVAGGGGGGCTYWPKTEDTISTVGASKRAASGRTKSQDPP